MTNKEQEELERVVSPGKIKIKSKKDNKLIKDYSKYIVGDLLSKLEIPIKNISPYINLFAINTIVSFSINKKKEKKLKLPNSNPRHNPIEVNRRGRGVFTQGTVSASSIMDSIREISNQAQARVSEVRQNPVTLEQAFITHPRVERNWETPEFIGERIDNPLHERILPLDALNQDQLRQRRDRLRRSIQIERGLDFTNLASRISSDRRVSQWQAELNVVEQRIRIGEIVEAQNSNRDINLLNRDQLLDRRQRTEREIQIRRNSTFPLFSQERANNNEIDSLTLELEDINHRLIQLESERIQDIPGIGRGTSTVNLDITTFSAFETISSGEETVIVEEPQLNDWIEEEIDRFTEVPFEDPEVRRGGRLTSSETTMMDFSDEWMSNSFHQYMKESISKVSPKVTKKELSIDEVRRQNYDRFINNFGGNPAIIKGYIIDDILYTTNNSIENIWSSLSKKNRIKAVIKVFTLNEDNTISSRIVCANTINGGYQRLTNTEYIREIVPIIFNLKVIDSEVSSDIFRNSKEKKELVKESLKYTIEYGQSKNLLGSTYYINTINESGKKLKFVFDDCLFNNSELTGYTPPLDKTMDVGYTVKLRKSRLNNYGVNPGNNVAIIISIKGNPSSKRISKACRNRRMDIITIRLESTNRILTVYGQDLKFISKPIKIKQNVTKESKKSKPEYR